ncbi:MAG: DUF432 domain-containing protein [bacterium]|nr:DUF432 domain-containing protein [candidate division KSB1 bacterium]MDH7559780.1 DUF432 domain-containing protein [bacterium]
MYIRAVREGDALHYWRKGSGGAAEKVVVTRSNRLIVNPVEPVNLPQNISTALLVHFTRPVHLEPKGRVTVFITFPIEVGVFVAAQRETEMLDVFSVLPSKFALYGPLGKGMVCKYWQSDIGFAPPPANPLHHGIIELTADNTTSRWAEISRAVFSAQGMKIYFNETMVAMRAEMKITAFGVAETRFLDSPLVEGMKKSLEVYRARRLSPTATKFVMEHGL